MTEYPHLPAGDSITVTHTGPDGPIEDAIQIYFPAHCGMADLTDADGADFGTLRIGSHHCTGCGERQTEVMIVNEDGLAFYVKLRPAMAAALAGHLLFHARAGGVVQ